jgi:hypothetical protein
MCALPKRAISHVNIDITRGTSTGRQKTAQSRKDFIKTGIPGASLGKS